MTFNIKKRGKLTYYYSGEHPVLSSLVTEEQPDGDLKIHFAGLTGGYSAKGVLGLEELVTMDLIKRSRWFSTVGRNGCKRPASVVR